jgi:mannose-6-phosphate isomerase-like protein (cupin superfamily)
MKLAIVLSLLAVVIADAAVTSAQSGQNSPPWTLRLNETRGPIRSANTSPLPQGTVSEILGGPTNGSDNAYLLYTRMAPGARGAALFTLPVEHYYVVTTGKMTVQIGTDTFSAEPMTGVVIPANVPHAVWNADAQPEAHLEVIAPAPSRDLMTMVKPAQPRKVDNAAQYLRHITVPAAKDLKPGLNGQVFTNRAMGSPNTVRLDSTMPGGGGPATHVHRFEQVYFIVEGTTTISYGADKLKASKNDIVILAPGVVHTNLNQSGMPERHLTMLLPQPPDGAPADIEFEMKPPAPARTGNPPAAETRAGAR